MKFYIFLPFFFISIGVQAQKKGTLTGLNAPGITFQKCLNSNISSNFYKDKILVIDFWATWCAPCIAGFPHFNELASKFTGNEVLFAAITDESKETAQKFFQRTKKQLNALKLIDTSQQTKKAFDVSYIPYVVVIDKNNIVRWSGDSGELTDTILNSIIKNQQLPPIDKQILTTETPKHKTIKERAFFYFDAAKSDTGKLSLQSSESFASYYSNIVTLNSQNNPLVDIIELITGYSKSRIITDNDSKINQHIDLDYKTGTDTSRFTNYTNSVFVNYPIKNYAITLLGDAFKFNAKIIRQKQKHYELITVDTAKLHSFRSMQSKHRSYDLDHLPDFEIIGYKLKEIITYLETNAKTIITTNIQDQNFYDLSLNIKDIGTLNQSLQYHGLKLVEVNDEIELLQISFY